MSPQFLYFLVFHVLAGDPCHYWCQGTNEREMMLMVGLLMLDCSLHIVQSPRSLKRHISGDQ